MLRSSWERPEEGLHMSVKGFPLSNESYMLLSMKKDVCKGTATIYRICKLYTYQVLPLIFVLGYNQKWQQYIALLLRSCFCFFPDWSRDFFAKVVHCLDWWWVYVPACVWVSLCVRVCVCVCVCVCVGVCEYIITQWNICPSSVFITLFLWIHPTQVTIGIAFNFASPHPHPHSLSFLTLARLIKHVLCRKINHNV